MRSSAARAHYDAARSLLQRFDGPERRRCTATRSVAEMLPDQCQCLRRIEAADNPAAHDRRAIRMRDERGPSQPVLDKRVGCGILVLVLFGNDAGPFPFDFDCVEAHVPHPLPLEVNQPLEIFGRRMRAVDDLVVAGSRAPRRRCRRRP